jgi:hypothetical protein
MNKPISVIEGMKANARNAEPSREVFSTIGNAPLRGAKKKAKEKPLEGCCMRQLRNLPTAYSDRFKEVKKAGLFRESFNQFMLDAINEKLAKDEKKMAKLAAKG